MKLIKKFLFLHSYKKFFSRLNRNSCLVRFINLQFPYKPFFAFFSFVISEKYAIPYKSENISFLEFCERCHKPEFSFIMSEPNCWFMPYSKPVLKYSSDPNLLPAVRHSMSYFFFYKIRTMKPEINMISIFDILQDVYFLKNFPPKKLVLLLFRASDLFFPRTLNRIHAAIIYACIRFSQSYVCPKLAK